MVRMNERATQIDKAIGEKVRQERLARGFSRLQVAERIDVTHQQFGKYENGINRISAGRLVAIAEALGRPVSFFFDGEYEPVGEATYRQRMTIEVSRNFMSLKSEKNQKAINNLIKALAEDEKCLTAKLS